MNESLSKQKTKWNGKTMKDNRKFWKTVNPLFLENSYSKESITVINKDGLITENEDLAKTFNNFFRKKLG